MYRTDQFKPLNMILKLYNTDKKEKRTLLIHSFTPSDEFLNDFDAQSDLHLKRWSILNEIGIEKGRNSWKY